MLHGAFGPGVFQPRMLPREAEGRIQEASRPQGSKLAQRVQVSNTEGLLSQKPYPQWYLGPASLHIGYSDPLGSLQDKMNPNPKGPKSVPIR